MLRWALRIVLGAVELAVFVVGLALFVVDTGWGHEQVRVRIETALRGAFPGGVTIGALEGNLLGEFVIRDMVVRTLDGRPAIRIGKLAAEVRVGSLFHKRAVIETLVAEDVTIRLGGGPLTKAADSAPDSQPSAWSVELPQIELRRGQLELEGGQPVTVRDVELTGDLAMPAGESLAAHVAMRGTWLQRRLPISVAGSLAIDRGVALPSLVATIGALRLETDHLEIDRVQPSGTIKLSATPAAIEAIDPRIVVPADVALAIVATRSSGAATQLAIEGTLGTATLIGAIRGDVAARTADGFVGVDGIDLAKFTQRANGRGTLAIAIAGDARGARGVIGIRGRAADVPESDATMWLDATWADRTATLTALAAGAGDTRAVATTIASWRDGRVTLGAARLWAVGKDLAAATAGRLPVVSDRELRASAKLAKPATLIPTLDVELSGTLHGAAVAYSSAYHPTIRVRTIDGTFDGKLAGRTHTGRVHANVRGAARGGEPLGSAVVDAEYLKDGRIWTRLNARPAAVPVGVVADAYVTVGKVVDVALGSHRVTPATGGAWTGTGGRIAISDTSVALRGLKSNNATGSVAIDGTFAFDSGAIDATVDAVGLPASAIDATFRGTASGKFAIRRNRTRWEGGGTLDAAALVLDPKLPRIDGKAQLALRGRVVTLGAHVTSPGIGGVKIALDVEGPRDITDVRAWRRLERAAVRKASINADHVDLAGQTSTGGTINGEVHLTGSGTTTLTVAGVRTQLGIAEGTVTVSPLGGSVLASWNAKLGDVGEGNVGLRITFPRYPFDPIAWKQLGRGVVQSLSASFVDVAIDPAKLAKLGVAAPYRGRADLNLAIGAAARQAKLNVDVRSIEGGVLREPIDVHVEATTDGNATTASARVARARDRRALHGVGSGRVEHPNLLELDVKELPVTFSTWLNAPNTALAAPLIGKLTIPLQSAPELLALIGRVGFDPKRGDVGGTIDVAGTLGRPTGGGKITARGLKLVSAIPGREIPELVELRIGGTWDGTTATVDARAAEVDGRELTAALSVRRDRLTDARASLRAKDLDLSPIAAALLPGELAASTGVLRGDVAIEGFELPAKLRGVLELDGAQIPLPTALGTLRNGYAKLRMDRSGITGSAHGLLGVCRDPADIETKQSCPYNVQISGLKLPDDLSKLEAELVVTNVAPIGEIEPVVAGTASISLDRTGRAWAGIVRVRNASVWVPPSSGKDLIDADPPDDVYFIENPPPESREFRPPARPWLVARVELDPTRVRIVDKNYDVTGEIASRDLRLLVGGGIGLDGKIVVVHGVADLVGRHYEIGENELVSFDGTIEPTIDLQLISRTPEMSLIVNIKGKPSDREFPTLRFEADPPGRYTEAELQALFFSGATTVDGGTQAKDIAYGVTASVLSRRIANQLNKVLPKPLRLDVLKCEPNTATAGASCTIARRFFHNKVYVAAKTRPAPRTDENGSELLAQYYFSQRLFVEAVVGTAGIVGADLLFRWRR